MVTVNITGESMHYTCCKYESFLLDTTSFFCVVYQSISPLPQLNVMLAINKADWLNMVS